MFSRAWGTLRSLIRSSPRLLPVSRPLSTTPPPPAPPGRLKAFFQKYGKLGVGVYFGISCLSLGSIYGGLRLGVDVKGLLHRMGWEGGLLEHGGTLAVAYAIHKAIMPLRILLTAGLTGYVAKRWPWLIK